MPWAVQRRACAFEAMGMGLALLRVVVVRRGGRTSYRTGFAFILVMLWGRCLTADEMVGDHWWSIVFHSVGNCSCSLAGGMAVDRAHCALGHSGGHPLLVRPFIYPVILTSRSLSFPLASPHLSNFSLLVRSNRIPPTRGRSILIPVCSYLTFVVGCFLAVWLGTVHCECSYNWSCFGPLSPWGPNGLLGMLFSFLFAV